MDEVVKQKFYDFAVERVIPEKLPEWKILWEEAMGRMKDGTWDRGYHDELAEKMRPYIKPEYYDDFKDKCAKFGKDVCEV